MRIRGVILPLILFTVNASASAPEEGETALRIISETVRSEPGWGNGAAFPTTATTDEGNALLHRNRTRRDMVGIQMMAEDARIENGYDENGQPVMIPFGGGQELQQLQQWNVGAQTIVDVTEDAYAVHAAMATTTMQMTTAAPTSTLMTTSSAPFPPSSSLRTTTIVTTARPSTTSAATIITARLSTTTTTTARPPSSTARPLQVSSSAGATVIATTPPPIVCLAGTYLATASSPTCTPCPWGYYCERNASDATATLRACPAGTANAYTGAESIRSCVPCDAGSHTGGRTGAAVCDACPVGFYCEKKSGVAVVETKACPSHTTSSAGARTMADCVCLPGYLCTYKREVRLRLLLNTALSLQELQSDPSIGAALRNGVLSGLGLYGVPGIAIAFEGFGV